MGLLRVDWVAAARRRATADAGHEER